MWDNILRGSLLIIACIFVHAIATRLVIPLMYIHKNPTLNKPYLKGFWLSIIVLVLFFASILESLIWAWHYNLVGAIPYFEEALYFSIVTYTTLGYGDITLSEEFRLLASFEAASGIIIFGWSTAIVVSSVQRLYHRE